MPILPHGERLTPTDCRIRLPDSEASASVSLALEQPQIPAATASTVTGGVGQGVRPSPTLTVNAPTGWHHRALDSQGVRG
jgi:hypothetical protein